MAGSDLGQQLFEKGWQQGVLLPSLSASVHFNLDDPLTRIALTAKPEADTQYQQQVLKGRPPLTRIAVGIGPIKTKDRLVIISQTCDIVKRPTLEPTVSAIRAFFASDIETVRRAGGSNKRQFILDEGRQLIAEMGPIVNIEKPALLELTPEPGVPDELTREQFAHWIADRFSRLPHSDEIVGAVVKPVLDKLRQLQNNADPDLAVLDYIHEIRFAKLQGLPPYEVKLLFMVHEGGLPDGGLGLARLVGHIEGCFTSNKARLVAWDAINTFDILLGDYLATDKLDVDEYTYHGHTTRGLVPLPRIPRY